MVAGGAPERGLLLRSQITQALRLRPRRGLRKCLMKDALSKSAASWLAGAVTDTLPIRRTRVSARRGTPRSCLEYAVRICWKKSSSSNVLLSAIWISIVVRAFGCFRRLRSMKRTSGRSGDGKRSFAPRELMSLATRENETLRLSLSLVLLLGSLSPFGSSTPDSMLLESLDIRAGYGVVTTDSRKELWALWFLMMRSVGRIVTRRLRPLPGRGNGEVIARLSA